MKGDDFVSGSTGNGGTSDLGWKKDSGVVDEKKLREIEERAEKATPGPWGSWVAEVPGPSEGVWEVPVPVSGPSEGPTTKVVVLFRFPRSAETKPDLDHDDAMFAMLARRDVPALIARVRELEAALEAKEAEREGE